MKKFLVLFVFLLALASCQKSYPDEAMYGTEWSSSDGQQNLKFLDGGRVEYHGSYGHATGTFKYDYTDTDDNNDSVYYKLNLSLVINGKTMVISSVSVGDTAMSVYWHYLYESSEHYMVLYKKEHR